MSHASFPHRWLSFLFLLVMFFVCAQVVWWTIFLSRQLRQTANQTIDAWHRDAAFLQQASKHVSEPTTLIRLCQGFYPHSTCIPPRFSHRSDAIIAIRQHYQRSLRMVILESSFFLLLVLIGLFLIAKGLYAEREIKKRQTNFLSAVSHEIRTPISTMRLLLETLLLRELPKEKQTRYLERMTGQLDRLQHTFEQVLSAAMLQEHEAKDRLEERDLQPLLANLLAKAAPEIEAKGVELTIDVAASPLFVSLDPLGVEMILHNLLDNASKHNPKPTKKIRVTSALEGSRVVVAIEDNGSGIPASESKRIFEPFYRIGSEMQRERTGLGLGLFLVRSLAHGMKAEILYEALPEGGSRFLLVWPKARVSSKKTSSPTPNTEGVRS